MWRPSRLCFFWSGCCNCAMQIMVTQRPGWSQLSFLICIFQDKTMFSIPWKHAARHGWELDKDACLFKKWAIHTGERAHAHGQYNNTGEGKTSVELKATRSTGKYVEGQVCDPKTWKANFRCAMNSLPDIEEVKDKSVNKGHQAMRVFRMLPVAQKSRGEKTDRKLVSVCSYSVL